MAVNCCQADSLLAVNSCQAVKKTNLTPEIYYGIFNVTVYQKSVWLVEF